MYAAGRSLKLQNLDFWFQMKDLLFDFRGNLSHGAPRVAQRTIWFILPAHGACHIIVLHLSTCESAVLQILVCLGMNVPIKKVFPTRTLKITKQMLLVCVLGYWIIISYKKNTCYFMGSASVLFIESTSLSFIAKGQTTKDARSNARSQQHETTGAGEIYKHR